MPNVEKTNEAAVISTIRGSFIESLNAHVVERKPRTPYWDLYWVRSFLSAMRHFYTLTKGSRHSQVKELHVLLGRLFDEAFPDDSKYRLNPQLAVDVIDHAHYVVAPKIRLHGGVIENTDTLDFEFKEEKHSIYITDTYNNVWKAFGKLQEPLRILAAQFGKPSDDVIEDPISQAEAAILYAKKTKKTKGAARKKFASEFKAGKLRRQVDRSSKTYSLSEIERLINTVLDSAKSSPYSGTNEDYDVV